MPGKISMPFVEGSAAAIRQRVAAKPATSAAEG